MTTAPASRPRPMLWGGLFLINCALIGAAHIFDVIEPPVPWILLALNMLLVIPISRAARQRQELIGAMSPALRVYNRRVLVVMFLYMAAMIAGGNLQGSMPEGSTWLWLLAIAPLAPLMGMIWAMVRYYRDEQDEYLRHRAVTGALIGLVLVLVLGTVWGFLEMFGLVPHVWNWWVFPVWSIGLGLGTCRPRGKGAEE